MKLLVLFLHGFLYSHKLLLLDLIDYIVKSLENILKIFLQLSPIVISDASQKTLELFDLVFTLMKLIQLRIYMSSHFFNYLKYGLSNVFG